MISICLSLKHKQYSPVVLVMKRISPSYSYKLTEDMCEPKLDQIPAWEGELGMKIHL